MDPEHSPGLGETLQDGPSRELLLDRLSPAQRQGGVVIMAFLLGVVACGGALWWWNGLSPERSRDLSRPPAAAGADVRLVLSRVAARPRPGDQGGIDADGPLRIDAVLLHGRGDGVATVTRIHRPGGSLAIRVPALPVRLSVNHSFERVRLQVRPRDCQLAAQWTPSAQPFLLTWQDDRGDVHVDLGGDHDAPMEIAMVRYLDAACGAPDAS